MAGYAKQRSNWLDYPTTTTPILASNLNAWETALLDVKRIRINPADYGLSSAASAATNTTAIQNALADCYPGPDTALRYATAELEFPSGLFEVSPDALKVKNAFGVSIRGAGQYLTRLIVNGTGTNLLELDGVPHLRIEGVGIVGKTFTTSHTVTNAINIHWGGTTGTATRRVMLRDVYITDLYFVNGIAIETADVTKQNDEITLQNFVVDGGTNPLSPDATWWQAGVKIGSGGVSGNTFQILMLRPGIQSCKRGVHAVGTAFHSYGGGFQANTYDFSIHALWRNSLVEGLRSEQATRLLTDEVGFTGTVGSMTMRDIWWNCANMNTDGNFIQFKQGGHLMLEHIHLSSWSGAGTAPWVQGASAGLGKTITHMRGCSWPVAPGSATDAQSATTSYINEDYTQTDAAGDASTAYFPGFFHSNPTVASATTTTLPPYGELFTISGTTTITSVSASTAGRRVTLVFSGALTFTDGSNLKLAGNFVTTADDAISLICDGTNWIETSRSVN